MTAFCQYWTTDLRRVSTESATTSTSSTALASKIKPGLHHLSQSESVSQYAEVTMEYSDQMCSWGPYKTFEPGRLGAKWLRIFEKGPVELGPDELSCLNIIQKSSNGKEDIESKSKVIDQRPKSTNVSHNALQWLNYHRLTYSHTFNL